MTVAEELRIVLTLSGLTQEKLAQRLGVSFATLNSWARARSVPRPRNKVAINDLFRKWTGSTDRSLSPLDVRKDVLKRKVQKTIGIQDLLRERRDLLDQLCLSLTYNTNRLEGSTLTEPETASILFDNVALSNKTLVEHLEVKNHQTAFLYLLSALPKTMTIDEALILKLHSILMNGVQPDAGCYRRHAVRIVGSYVPTANYLKISDLMKVLVDDLQRESKDVVSHVAQIHSRFEQIHPFSDGNGRIGRLLIQAMLLKQNYPPALILQRKKRAYLSALNKAQLKGDFHPLEEFLCDSVLSGLGLLEGFDSFREGLS